MTFHPKVVPLPEDDHVTTITGSDEPHDLPLPDDLVRLGEQLSHESAFLERRFPPIGRSTGHPAIAAIHGGEPSNTVAKSDRPGLPPPGAGVANQGVRFLGPALVALLAVGGVGISLALWLNVDHPSSQNSQPAPTAPAWHAVKFVPPRTERAARSDSESFVREVSGPELEGLLDLLEAEQDAPSRLSI